MEVEELRASPHTRARKSTSPTTQNVTSACTGLVLHDYWISHLRNPVLHGIPTLAIRICLSSSGLPFPSPKSGQPERNWLACYLYPFSPHSPRRINMSGDMLEWHFLPLPLSALALDIMADDGFSILGNLHEDKVLSTPHERDRAHKAGCSWSCICRDVQLLRCNVQCISANERAAK